MCNPCGNAGTALGRRSWLAGNSPESPAARDDTLALRPGLGSQEIKAVLENCKIIYKYLPAKNS